LVRIAQAKPWEQMKKFGPYRQNERKDLYQKYAEQLVATNWLLC
jgi:glutamyl/glutaminyl-tRNA synthetase